MVRIQCQWEYGYFRATFFFTTTNLEQRFYPPIHKLIVCHFSVISVYLCLIIDRENRDR